MDGNIVKTERKTKKRKSVDDSSKPPKRSKAEKKRDKALKHDLAAQTAEKAVAHDEQEDIDVPEKVKKLKTKKKRAAGDDRKVEATAKQPSTPSRLAAVGNKQVAGLRPLLKNFYSEHQDVSNLSEEDVKSWRAKHGVIVQSDKDMATKPILQFSQAGFSPELLAMTKGFQQPTLIQSQCWPIALSGQDLVGIAATGSGKTLAFGLPAVKHILAQKKTAGAGKGPFALVLAPTRELAVQIEEVMRECCRLSGLKSACLYGGVPKGPQKQALKSGVDLVTATPGRLEDLVNEGVCSLANVSYFVLDEADRLLDLGFEPHVRGIAKDIRADRQTLMFSATWPKAVQALAADFLASPAKVTIGSEKLSANTAVTQVVEVIEGQARDARLQQLLEKYHKSRTNRIIIFVLYKKEASRVEAMLNRRGWKAVGIHGDLSQEQRTRAVDQFKSGKISLLVATDVAARGLDVPDVEVVLNYSFPLTIEDYVHRIGRTARAGKTGLAHTFFVGQTDKALAGALSNVLRSANQNVPQELINFGTTVKKKESALYGAHFKEVDMSAKATKISFESDNED